MSNQIFPTTVRGLAYTVVKSLEDSVNIQESSNFQSTRLLQSQNPRWHWRLEYSVVFDNILNPNPQLTYTDLQTMLGFCQARYVNYDDFLYSDPDDNSFGPGIITATWQPNFPYMFGAIIINSGHAFQVSGFSGNLRSGLVTPTFTVGGFTTDGGVIWSDLGAVTGTGWPNPYAQLQVVTDGTNYYSPIQRNLGGQVYEDITDLNGAITVYSNGTLTTSYTLGFGGLAIPGFSSLGMYINWGTIAPTQPITATFNYYFRVRMEESSEDFEKFVNELWAIGGEENVQGKGYLKFESSPPQGFALGTARNTAGIPTMPAPPVNACGSNLQQVTLYPTNVSNANFPAFGNMSYGSGNYTFLIMRTSGGLITNKEPNSVFSVFYLPSSIPAALVQCVYLYIAWTHQADPSGRTAIGQSQAFIGSTPIIGGFSTTTTGSGLFIQRVDGGGFPAATFPFQAFSVSVNLLRSLGPSFGLDDELTAQVSLVVFYT